MVHLSVGDPGLFDGVIETVEMHAGGEPVRIVTSGYPAIPGKTILDKRRFARDHLDHLRTRLIFEPRGHDAMYGVIPVEPDVVEADMAVLFMHNEGYSTMCGHAIIALGRYAVDHAIVAATAPLTQVLIQCPCGLVRVHVEVKESPEGYQSGAVYFESVPSFAFALDWTVCVPGLGDVSLDIGYGGAFYALVAARSIGLDLDATPLSALIDAADAITKATATAVELDHPDDADLAFLYGTILTDGRDPFEETPTQNVCVFAERQVDRSPTGSGVSARVAVQVARGQIALGQQRRFQSLTGAVFTGRPSSPQRTGRFESVRVEVGGRAFYCGMSRFHVEPQDDLGNGFLIR